MKPELYADRPGHRGEVHPRNFRPPQDEQTPEENEDNEGEMEDDRGVGEDAEGHLTQERGICSRR